MWDRRALEGAPRFSGWRYRLTLIFVTVVIMGVITLWWAERQLSGPLSEWATARATTIATAAINAAISESLAEELDRDDLIQFVRGEGEAPLIRYQTGAINLAVAKMVSEVIRQLEAVGSEDVAVPLGELTGMGIIAGRGPRLPIRIVTTNQVTVEPIVDFRAAGINQISHRIYLDVEVRMIVIAPFLRSPVSVRQPVLLSEAIVPGDVPGTYVNLVGYSGSLAEWTAIMESIR